MPSYDPPNAPEDSKDFAASPRSPESTDEEDEAPLGSPSLDSNPLRIPSLRSTSDPTSMTPSSTPLGLVQNARRPNVPSTLSSMRTAQSSMGGQLPQSMEAKMR